METYLQVAKRALDLSFSKPSSTESYRYFIEAQSERTEDQKKQATASKRKTRILPNSLPRAFP